VVGMWRPSDRMRAAWRRKSPAILPEIFRRSPRFSPGHGLHLAHQCLTGWCPWVSSGRCAMPLVTVYECLTFFFSIAVLLYLWIP
jgi:hypothetical protein